MISLNFRRFLSKCFFYGPAPTNAICKRIWIDVLFTCPICNGHDLPIVFKIMICTTIVSLYLI